MNAPRNSKPHLRKFKGRWVLVDPPSTGRYQVQERIFAANQWLRERNR